MEAHQRVGKVGGESVFDKGSLSILIAVVIPILFFGYGIQTKRYTDLSKEVSALEKRQEDLIEQNKKYVSDISLLSSTDRIETFAVTALGMHKVDTEDIVRVDVAQTH